MGNEDIRTVGPNRYSLTAERDLGKWQVTIGNVQTNQRTRITVAGDWTEEEATGLAWHQFLSPKGDE